ncbi:GNAT family N-acetyltransferase [Erythrobacter sp.]|uniref:GNAT family N-acetyltransferase n=1 Tax=Erythrobacter sp. TaxID=1042 RepID=UPI003C75C48D
MRGTIITTRRLKLRTWRTSDVAAYHKHSNTEPVMEYLGGVMSRGAVDREVRWFQQDNAKHGHTFWAMERERDQALLGFCGIVRVREPGTSLDGKLEIGWRLRADVWGHGYATEAAEAVIDWAEWEKTGELLLARIHQDNEPSQRLARRVGMRRARAIEARLGEDDADHRVFKIRL